ncbi:MAG: hypothetical protein ACPGVO_04600 [Spirulinaceae cyanobacterium]
MTTPHSAPRSAVAQAIALLSHYGFDTKPYTAAERVGHWLDDYESNWIRFAIIEALYQGRYKSISVEHILSMWVRRGQPSQHFNGDFERIICRKLPANFQSSSLNALEHLAEPAPKTQKAAAPKTVAPETVVPEIVASETGATESQGETIEPAIGTEHVPDEHYPKEQTASNPPERQRRRRRRRPLGIQQWRWLAKQGTTAYDEGLISRLKTIAVILPTQLEAGGLPLAAIVVHPTLEQGELLLKMPQTDLPTTARATDRVDITNAVDRAAIVIDVDGITVSTPDITPDQHPEKSPKKRLHSPTLKLPRTEPLPLQVRSGILTFRPRLRLSPFFIRLKAFRSAIIWLPVMAPAALPPAPEPRQARSAPLASPTAATVTASEPTPADSEDHEPDALDAPTPDRSEAVLSKSERSEPDSSGVAMSPLPDPVGANPGDAVAQTTVLQSS